MLGLIAILVLIGVVLGVLLWVGSIWFQGYIYSEPAAEIHWGAPVAGLALALFFALWCFLEYRNPERFETVFNFSHRVDKDYPEFWTVRGKEKTHYTQSKNPQGQIVYLDADRRPPKTHPDAIIVKEDNREIQFKAERDAQGKFKIEPGRSLRYLDEQGRVMVDPDFGRLSTSRTGLLFLNLAFNLLHLGVWFACLWLLLRFQWSHALGLAVVFWLIMTLTMMPMLLARVQDLAAQPAVKAPATTAQIKSESKLAMSPCVRYKRLQG